MARYRSSDETAIGLFSRALITVATVAAVLCAAAVRMLSSTSTTRKTPASGQSPAIRAGTGRDGKRSEATRARKPSSSCQAFCGCPLDTDTSAEGNRSAGPGLTLPVRSSAEGGVQSDP